MFLRGSRVFRALVGDQLKLFRTRNQPPNRRFTMKKITGEDRLAARSKFKRSSPVIYFVVPNASHGLVLLCADSHYVLVVL